MAPKPDGTQEIQEFSERGLTAEEATDGVLPFFNEILGLETEDDEDDAGADDDAQPESDDDEDEEVEDTDSDEDADESEEDEDADADDDLDDSEDEIEDDAEEDAGNDDEDEDSDETDTFTVFDEDGNEEQVTREEAKSRGLRQADYMRKTQAIAVERKALTDERASLQTERAQAAVYLRTLEQAITATGPEETPDWDALKAESPEKYAVAMADHQRRQENLRAVHTEQQRLQHQMIETNAETMQEQATAENELLLAAIPEWSDSAVARKANEDLSDYAINTLGFTAEELAATIDHRAILMLRDSFALHQLQEDGETAVKKKKKKRVKPLKPGGSGSRRKSKKSSAEQKLVSDQERLNEDGDKDAAASILEQVFFAGDGKK